MTYQFDPILGTGRDGAVMPAAVRTALSADAAAGRTALGLGTAATAASTAYATAAQGAKADSALQPAGAAAISAATTLTAADNMSLKIATGNPALTVNAGMPAGWHVPVSGACTFVAGIGGPTITDHRKTGATNPFCVISASASGYLINGSAA